MQVCTIINKLIGKGTLAWDLAGRVMMGDSSPIRRMGGETFKQAYDRGRSTTTHLIQIVDSEEDSDETDGSSEDKWESEEDKDQRVDVFAIQDLKGELYNAE